MKQSNRLSDLVKSGVSATLHHTLGYTGFTALAGLAGLAAWLCRQESRVWAIGAVIVGLVVLLGIVATLIRQKFLRRRVTIPLGGGDPLYVAFDRDRRDREKLGYVHIHIDGDSKLVHSILQDVDSNPDDSSKYPRFREQPVRDWIGGPQRALQPDVYRYHNPGVGPREEFGAFSTSVNIQLKSVLPYLQRIVPLVKSHSGVVVEAEYVQAVIDTRGRWRTADLPNRATLAKFWQEIRPPTSGAYEVHFAFDIRCSDVTEPPITLRDLLSNTSSFLPVGGWFLFELYQEESTENVWCYRSNHFLEKFRAQEKRQVYGQYIQLAGYLSGMAHMRSFSFTLRTLVERILAIVKGDGLPSKALELTEITSIANWECEQGWDNYWVVAPNFAGDVDKNIEEAMRKNLQRGTRYTYFLQSKADVRRLDRFVRNTFALGANIGAVLLSPFHQEDHIAEGLQDGWFLGFVGNDLDPWFAQGLRMRRDKDGQIIGAHEISVVELGTLVRELRPLIRSTVTQGINVPLAREKELGTFAVLCTDIRDSQGLRSKLDAEKWGALMDDYEAIVFEATSRNDGYVGRELLDGFALAVPVKSAIRCATSIHEKAVSLFSRSGLVNPHRIAIDWGEVSMRIPGPDLNGPRWSSCLDLVRSVPAGEIRITDVFCRVLSDLGHLSTETDTAMPEEFSTPSGSTSARLLKREIRQE